MNYEHLRISFPVTLHGRSLANFLETTWAMHHHHKWTVQDLEDITPWELDVMINLTRNHIEKIQAAKGIGQAQRGNLEAYQGPPPEVEKAIIKQQQEQFRAARLRQN